MQYITATFRTVFLFLFMLAAGHTFSQQVFLQLTDATGQPIKGNSLTRGYERQIMVEKISGGNLSTPTVTITMAVQPASGTLQNLKGSKTKLKSGIATITERSDAGTYVVYTVYMEDIQIEECSDATSGGVSVTTVKLKPARIGTTYYSRDRKTGAQTISSKTGFDLQTGQPWTKF